MYYLFGQWLRVWLAVGAMRLQGLLLSMSLSGTRDLALERAKAETLGAQSVVRKWSPIRSSDLVIDVERKLQTPDPHARKKARNDSKSRERRWRLSIK